MTKKEKRPRKAILPNIAMGSINYEPLPLGVVYYPNHYGTFISFGEKEGSDIFLCECSKEAIVNYLALKAKQSVGSFSDPLRSASLDNYFFPDRISSNSLQYSQSPLSSIRFGKKLCHRCNLISPQLRYCHEMYGVQFIQYHGWYVNQTYLRLGIMPLSLDYLSDICPLPIQEKINRARASECMFRKEESRLLEMAHGPRRADIAADEVTYWSNVKIEEAETMVALRREMAQHKRSVTIEIENITRQEFGFRKVGEGWVSETLLFQIVSRIFDGHEIIRHFRPSWLKGLELDIYIPAINVGIEYQGQQHFHAIKAWGGQKALEKVQLRDEQKASVCKNLGVSLITVDYTEPLTEEYIRHRLSNLI